MSDQTAPTPTYRVVQWATGNIGSRSIRAVIEHPQMTLVGVHVNSPDKEGIDAGELCGLGPIGVAATRTIDDILAVEPDCVLYMRQGMDIEEITTLLESGANVVTTCGEFHHPGSMDVAMRDRIEAACDRGSTSIHSTGISPGFISEAMPIVLTSIQRRLDRLQIEEFADVSSRNSPEMLFQLMGFGRDRSAFDSVESTGEVAVATRDVEIAAGTVAAGTVAAQRMTVAGMRHGAEFLSFSANWYCSTEIDADWDLREGGWRVTVAGDCPLDIDIRLAIPLERMAETTPGYTANRAVNSVPVVCEAEPGIRTTVDLPQVVARLG